MNRSQTDTGSAPKALLPSSCTNNQAGSTQNSKNSKNINKSTKVGCYVCGSESVEYIGILSGNTIHSSAKDMKDLLILCKTHQSMYLEKVLGVIFHNFIIPEFNINFPFFFQICELKSYCVLSKMFRRTTSRQVKLNHTRSLIWSE